MSGAILDALTTPPPDGVADEAGERCLVAGLAAEMLADVRARAASELRLLGAAPPVLDGIGAYFVETAWLLLGAHARDQSRIWQATSGGWAHPGAARSEAFAAYMRTGGWAALLDRLPPLAALVSKVVELEAQASAELMSRAAADAEELAARFGTRGRLGPLVRVSPGLSDPHNGRRTVASLVFSDGARVIYKPRPVAMEQGLSRTLSWLRGAGLEVPAGSEVLERDGYGWCEFIEHRPCASRAEVDDYFRRLGALAAVLASLAATDCHAENFIARGPDPMLVDAETLLHPRLLASPGYSVLETEIVPSQVGGPGGQLIDYAGFDAPAAGHAAPPNLPSWAGRSHLLRDHRPGFAQSVDATRDALRGLRRELMGPEGPVGALANRPARVVLRPTSVYAALLAHTLSASALASRDGGLGRAERELIRYQDPGMSPQVWDAVRREELASMTQGDVPYFLADTSTGDLGTLDGRVLGAGAVEPVLPGLEARIS